jgi:hypothetical protein
MPQCRHHSNPTVTLSRQQGITRLGWSGHHVISAFPEPPGRLKIVLPDFALPK